MSSPSSAPTLSTAPGAAIGPELMDAKGSPGDPLIPINAISDIISSTISSDNSSPDVRSKTPQKVDVNTKSPKQGAEKPDSISEDVSILQNSLQNIKLGHKTSDSIEDLPGSGSRSPPEPPSENAPLSLSGKGSHSTNSSISSQPETPAPIRLASRATSPDGPGASPVIVVLSQSQTPEPFDSQLQTVLANVVDEPDPRLLDALENPRDRLFVIKLEQDILHFVKENTCEIFDIAPINAYYRLLAHKIAEYYRLTHVADATGSSVRLYRGQCARIPPVRLSERPLATPPRDSVSNVSTPAVKIMRRTHSERGSDMAADQSFNGSKAASDASSTDSTLKQSSREAREAAYLEARARIFKDFEESPPETPTPTKAPSSKQKKQDRPDDFHSRSQFFSVISQPPPQPTAVPQFYPQHEDPRFLPQNGSHAQIPPRNFNPSTPSFTPSVGPPGYMSPPYAPPMPNRQFLPPTERAYSPLGQSQMPPSIFPQRNGFFPEHPQGYDHGIPQQQHHSAMMNSSFNSGSRFPQHPFPHPHAQHATSMPPSSNRNPYSSPSNYAVGVHMLNSRLPPFVTGLSASGPVGGYPMNARSSSGPAAPDRHSPPFGGMSYQSHQPAPWGGNGPGFHKGGYGNGGGMHGPVGGL